jgi:hypothetical protein
MLLKSDKPLLGVNSPSINRPCDKAFTSRPARDSKNGSQIAFLLGSSPRTVASVGSSIKPHPLPPAALVHPHSFERDHLLEQTDDD